MHWNASTNQLSMYVAKNVIWGKRRDKSSNRGVDAKSYNKSNTRIHKHVFDKFVSL